MRRVVLLDTALSELTAISEWIARRSGSVDAGLRVSGQLYAKCQSLAALPIEIGVSADIEAPNLGLKRYPHKNFVLYLRYPDDQTLEVVAILWGGRDRSRYFEDLLRNKKP